MKKKKETVVWSCAGFRGYKSNRPEDIDRRRERHAITLATAKIIEMNLHTLTTLDL